MILYRIGDCNYVHDLAGTGARLYGGRWNSEGRSVTYLASSRSLAVLEVLVHLPPLIIPDNYCLIEIEVPDGNLTSIAIDDLPHNWKDVSPPVSLKQLGDEFLRKQENLLMQVPSSIVPAEYNYLLNPQHPGMAKVKILNKQPFDFDKRLSPAQTLAKRKG
jgi:RES domain-containing protein